MDQPNSSQDLPLLDHRPNMSVNELASFDNAAILNHIFKDLEPRSLFCIALVCRRFKDPALYVLWSSLDSLLPLLKLLGPLYKPNNNTYVYQGPFNEAEWPIFDAYARRVKRLTLPTTDNNDKGEKFAFTAIQRLSRRRPSFFPDLRDLSCPSVFPIHTPLFSLLSPTLERLELGGDQTAYDELIEPIVSTIIHESEESRLSLKRLILHKNPPSNPLGSLHKLSNLLQLSISAPVSFDFFKAVGILDNLEDLSIVLSDPPNVPMPKLGFGGLRSLNITSPLLPLREILEGILTTRLSFISIMAPQVARPGPREIRMKTKKPEVIVFPAYKVAECLNTLNSRWRLSLQSIILDHGEPYRYRDPMSFKGVSPLLCFENLEHLRLHHSNFCPTDMGIHNLALACPNIQKFCFPIDCPDPSINAQPAPTPQNAAFAEATGSGGVDKIAWSQSRTTTTIASLWSLAELCPKLTHVEIGLDITGIPPFFPNNVHSHRLSSLSVGSYNSTKVGPITTLKIARHIHRLFPHLTIQSHRNHNSTIWDQIGHVVDAYKMVVLDEETRKLKQHALNSQTVNCSSH